MALSQKEEREISFFKHTAMEEPLEHWIRGDRPQARKKSLTVTQPRWHPDLKLLASRLWENKFRLFKPPSLWYFVMTADLTNTQDLLHFLSEIVITLVITKTSGLSLLADHNLHDGRTSLAVQWSRPRLPVQGVWVQFLVGELRSHMHLWPKKQSLKQKQYCNQVNKDFKNGTHLKKKY